MLNAVSTTFTILGFGFLSTLLIFATVFWIIMILNAARRGKYLWAAVVFFTHIIGAFLYYFIEKPRFKPKNRRKLGWIFLAVFALWTLIFIIPFSRARSGQPGEAITQFFGTVTGIDLSSTATNGQGIYKVKDITGYINTVNLSSSKTTCDPEAIKVPEVKLGDRVFVSGKQGADGIVRICDGGTYLKKE